ncbi:MAG: tRNA (adenosine(37)-N6)-threonylcarbamoyltransferase complex dimerization subunit type 1 TsaB [Methylotenera sp.]|nr:tRNA (adenosine(37)-N6)-threonylcarbamoyltransferase complex dimerization subunit type 1 TsaB [Oligoflexia bacterium]
MKLLAWDTSQKAGALVALEWDPENKAKGYRLVSEWAINVDSTHSEQLLWGIHQLLQSVRWKLEDIDVFGVGVGPGSFTGLRIGITTARTLASALNKPLIGVSSLAALARPAALWLAQQKSKTVLIACTDACKGELFALWGNAKSLTDCVVLADGDYPGLWKRGAEEQVISPDELMKAVRKKLAEGTQKENVHWVAIGEGRNRYPDAWKLLPADQEIPCPVPFSDQVQGRYLGLLVWEAFQAGLVRKPLEVHPRYVRASDAELKLKAGLLPKGPTRG